ncbi:MAG TPA: hypothetical protein PK129_08140, partial [Cellvibrionaceae bacterium]|nr:hypothetical protein [Cellvibrionaceae bacterium]
MFCIDITGNGLPLDELDELEEELEDELDELEEELDELDELEEELDELEELEDALLELLCPPPPLLPQATRLKTKIDTIICFMYILRITPYRLKIRNQPWALY